MHQVVLVPSNKSCLRKKYWLQDYTSRDKQCAICRSRHLSIYDLPEHRQRGSKLKWNTLYILVHVQRKSATIGRHHHCTADLALNGKARSTPPPFYSTCVPQAEVTLVQV